MPSIKLEPCLKNGVALHFMCRRAPTDISRGGVIFGCRKERGPLGRGCCVWGERGGGSFQQKWVGRTLKAHKLFSRETFCR